jgi:hypothetical protein
MIIWRIGAAHSNAPATRYRAVYPAFCLWRTAEINSTFTCGSPSRRSLTFGEIAQKNVLVLSSDGVSEYDVELAALAADAGWRVVLDQVENPFEAMASDHKRLGYIEKQLLPSVHAITFASRPIRNECVANGFPAGKCHIAPVPDLSGQDARRAVEWAHSRVFRFSAYGILPARKGWLTESSGAANSDSLIREYGSVGEIAGERGCSAAWLAAVRSEAAPALAG